MPLLKRYFPESLSSPILYEIDVDMVQAWVEPNLDRKLTENELERMHYAMTEDSWLMLDMIMECAEKAIDNTNNQWDWVDKDVEARKPLYMLGDYWIGEDII